MNLSINTLVHEAALPIACPCITSFLKCHPKAGCLNIHIDGSVTEGGKEQLAQAAAGHEFRIVGPEDRQNKVAQKVEDYPQVRELIGRGGYCVKFEIPLWADKPFFFFDSDIFWLRTCQNLGSWESSAIFSAESWTYYPGMVQRGQWAKKGIPSRVNSGFYFLREEFPVGRMEDFLGEELYDPSLPYATDQEVMAATFPAMQQFCQKGFMRARRRMIYPMKEQECVALHFPGGGWRLHLEQFEALFEVIPLEASAVEVVEAKRLSKLEFLKIDLFMKLTTNTFGKALIKIPRRLRAQLLGGKPTD